MGLNTAIGDGHNLGWKLAWVVNGWAGEALLDSYSAERRAVGLHNTLRSMGTTEQASADGLVEDLGIVYRSTAVVAEHTGREVMNRSDTAVPAVLLSAAPGARAPHVWLGVDGRRVSTLDLFDGRFTLLSGRAGRWALPGCASLPLDTLTCDQDFVDLDGAFHEAHGIEPEGAVLVRPDGHIAWRCSNPGPSARAELVNALGRCIDLPDLQPLQCA